jgi:hypothetical protein
MPFFRLAENGYIKELAALKANNVVHTINRIGSMTVHFDATDFKSAANGDNDTFKKVLSWIIKKEFILRHPLMKVGL